MAVLQGYGFNGFGQFSLSLLKELWNNGNKIEIKGDVQPCLCSENAETILILPSLPNKVIVSSTWDAIYLYITCQYYTGSYTSSKWLLPLKTITETYCTTPNDMIDKVWELPNGNLAVSTTLGHHIISQNNGEYKVVQSTVNDYWKFSNNQCYCLTSEGHLFQSDINIQLLYPAIPMKGKIKRVSVGSDHAVLLTETQMLYSYGLGTHGQLGTGDLLPRDHPCLIEALAGLNITHISSGYWHSLALSQFGDIYSWGWNKDGQLGHTPNEIIVPIPYLIERIEDNVMFKTISCGTRHSSGVTNNGHCYMWGWNKYKQTGTVLSDCIYTPQIICSNVNNILCFGWNSFIVKNNF